MSLTTKEITTELKITARQLRLLIAKGKDGCFDYAGRRFAVEKRGSGHFTKYIFTEVERPAVERVGGRPDLDAMDMSQLKMEKTKSEVRQNWSKEEAEVDRIRREALAEAEAEWSKFLQQLGDVARKIIHTDADRELWNKCIKEITK